MNRLQRDGLARHAFAAAVLAATIAGPGAATPAHAALPQITGVLLADGLIATLIYSFIGIFMAFLSYRVIDFLTPGDLSRELTENRNVALAVLTGSMILGVCIIIAAAIAG